MVLAPEAKDTTARGDALEGPHKCTNPTQSTAAIMSAQLNASSRFMHLIFTHALQISACLQKQCWHLKFVTATSPTYSILRAPCKIRTCECTAPVTDNSAWCCLLNLCTVVCAISASGSLSTSTNSVHSSSLSDSSPLMSSSEPLSASSCFSFPPVTSRSGEGCACLLFPSAWSGVLSAGTTGAFLFGLGANFCT
jgi:hypothetical protein